MVENINIVLGKLLEKIEPEKRSIALPLILDDLKRKQKENKKIVSNKDVSNNIIDDKKVIKNCDIKEVDIVSQLNTMKDVPFQVEEKVIVLTEEIKPRQEIQKVEEDNQKVNNDSEDFATEEIEYSLNYDENISESKKTNLIAEINATVEKSDAFEENDMKKETLKKTSSIITPTVLSCKAVVCKVSSDEDLNSEEVTVEPVALKDTEEPSVVKVPVVLSQGNIEIFIEALTKFPEPIFSIEDIDKSLTLTYCQLFPNSNRLLLKGYVEKNIEYSNAVEIYDNEISGDIKNLTIRLPFKCGTEVTFARKPHSINNATRQKVEIFQGENKYNERYKAEEKSSVDIQDFGNKIYCKLEAVTITEKSKKLGIVPLENTLEGTFIFNKLKEKTVVSFTLSLLQNQKIFMPNREEVVIENCEENT